jgi:two-component system, chemotaxis family, CheB/CheR fusion protein
MPTIVGIGASAGGLEALSELLASLPVDLDLALVIVQHLSPQHASALPAIMSARTQLTVVEVEDGTKLQPNHVYVVPPAVQLEMSDGVFQVLPRPHDRSQYTPIDFFLQSLARSAQDKAVAVILSGTASDGAVGVREIKAMGGITIAQRPETAKYDGMPRAAIGTGMIDLVLSPSEIGEHLRNIRQHPYLLPRPAAREPGDDLPSGPQLRHIFEALRRESGIDFAHYKRPTVNRRLLRRMALHRLTDFDAYIRFMREQPAEVRALSKDLLIHVTQFFRNPESFEVLAGRALPEIVNRQEEDRIRIWVPGCATGEEAYSIAIALAENLTAPADARRVQIFATDVSGEAIDVARAGTYPLTIVSDVSPDRLARFFERSDGGYRVSKRIRDMCVFARHDLTRDPPFSKLDLIMCRNVLIYLEPGAQQRLVSIFHYALKPGRFLMLGAAETVGARSPFTLLDKKWRLYTRASADAGMPAVFQQEHGSDKPGKPPQHELLGTEVKSSHDEANRIVLDKFGPPGVIVDPGFHIVQFRGHTGPYLEPASGTPNLDVFKMARGGLLHPLKTALQSARRRGRSVRKEGVAIQRQGVWSEIDLEVVPLTAPAGHFLVLFIDAEERRQPRKGGRLIQSQRNRTSLRQADESARLRDLRHELSETRDYLQSIVNELEAANEALQSANEEILSSNEELQSTNEELDTTKEELQATNEELNTVNDELHARNEELIRVNSDLVNLLASVDIAIIIVDEETRIRRFTPKAEELFNLIAGDVGRPIGQITHSIPSQALESVIQATMRTVAPVQRDTQDRLGRWYSLRGRPYKGVDNRLDGAVIAAIDVDASKRHAQQVEEARDFFRAIVETAREPMLILDADLHVRMANRSFYRCFNVAPHETESFTIYELGDGQWDIAPLRQLLAEVMAGRAAMDFTLDHDFPRIGPRLMKLNARPLPLEQGHQGILIAIEDLSDAEKRD